MSASVDYLADVPDEYLTFAREIVEFATAALEQFGYENDHFVAGLIRERGQSIIERLTFSEHSFLQSESSGAKLFEERALLVSQAA